MRDLPVHGACTRVRVPPPVHPPLPHCSRSLTLVKLVVSVDSIHVCLPMLGSLLIQMSESAASTPAFHTCAGTLMTQSKEAVAAAQAERVRKLTAMGGVTNYTEPVFKAYTDPACVGKLVQAAEGGA